VTVAIKGVVASDVIAEVATFSALEGQRYMQASTLVSTLLGDFSNFIILVVITCNVIMKGFMNNEGIGTMSIFRWSGYLGCMGAMQSFILPSFLSSIFFPFLVLGVVLGASAARASGHGDNKDSAKAVSCGAVLFVMAFGPPSVGFVIYVFGGIPPIFPMLGFVICAAITACVLKIIILLPDYLLARMSNGRDAGLEDVIFMQLGLGILLTVILCAPRSAMAWNHAVGIGGSYKFTFTTLGAMPVHEGFGTFGIDLIFGAGASTTPTVYSTCTCKSRRMDDASQTSGSSSRSELEIHQRWLQMPLSA
jgi:hypothetical protein